MTDDAYKSPGAVEAAIRAAAKNASVADPSISVGDRIRQEYFRRFLSRVFADRQDDKWILKGGTSVLARVGSARTTRDMDLFRNARSVEDALDDLKQAASLELNLVPATWGRRYAEEARSVPACSRFRTVDLAMDLMRTFIDPVLKHDVGDAVWNPASLCWEEQ